VGDSKTDRGCHAEPEYRKQLSVYYHVVRAVYPDREVSATTLYAETGTLQAIDPLSADARRPLVGESETASTDS